MAIIKKGILGGFSGTAGTVVGAKNRKKDTMRSKPTRSAKASNNPTQPQNLKLSLLVPFLKNFTSSINIGFSHKKNNDSSFNRATSYNLTHAIKGEHPNFELDYTKVLFSKGSREAIWSGKISYTAELSLTISWEIPDTAKLRIIGKDKLQVIVAARNSALYLEKPDVAERKDLSTTFKLPKRYLDDILDVWIFFVSPDAKKTSNSYYLGSI